MKKIVLLIVLLALCPIVRAEDIPITFTDKVYSDGVWYQDSNANIIGPANRGGFAQRFVLDQSYTISSISGFFEGVNVAFANNPEDGNIKYKIYNGSSYGSSGNFLRPSDEIIISSKTFNVPIDNQEKEYKTENLNIDLPTGDYWFAASGGTKDGLIRFKNLNIAGQVTTPEPATFLLLGGGLFVAFRFRRKK